jgi:Asp-tRNA(Asn)/Glu-tRNA(Gln) amidotransferase A subunit family amidase
LRSPIRSGNGLALVLVPRFLQALGLFAAGAAFSWWISHPATVVVTTAAPETDAPEAPDRAAMVAAFGNHVDEPTIGVPPESATMPKSHPSAGQRRALARALDDLARSGAAIEPQDLDDEATALMADRIRERLLAQGDPP